MNKDKEIEHMLVISKIVIFAVFSFSCTKKGRRFLYEICTKKLVAEQDTKLQRMLNYEGL